MLAVLNRYILVFYAAIFMISDKSFAAQSQGTAKASVVEGINIDKVSDINFGSIAPTSVQGTVSINNQGEVSLSNVSHLGNQSIGEYIVNGPQDGSYTPAISSLTQLSDGSNTMAVSLAIDGGVSNRQITSGIDVLKIIGTLTVQADQAPNTYSGTYNITAGY